MLLLDAIGQFLDDAFLTNSLGRSNLIVLLRVTEGAGFEEIQKHLKHDFRAPYRPDTRSGEFIIWPTTTIVILN
jgi:hypothetical protein